MQVGVLMFGGGTFLVNLHFNIKFQPPDGFSCLEVQLAEIHITSCLLHSHMKQSSTCRGMNCFVGRNIPSAGPVTSRAMEIAGPDTDTILDDQILTITS